MKTVSPLVPHWPSLSGEVHRQRIEAALAQARQMQEALASSSEAPTFENTLDALEKIDQVVRQAYEPFSVAVAFDTTPDLEAANEAITEPLTQFRLQLFQDPAIAQRVKAIAEDAQQLQMRWPEDQWLVTQTLQRFERNGAHLSPTAQSELQALYRDLALAQLAFGKAVREANQMTLVVDDPDELAGLPHDMIEEAAQRASERGQEGRWAFLLGMAPVRAALEVSQSTVFRRALWNASQHRCQLGEHDTRERIRTILRLRSKIAQKMGYDNWAQFSLADQMAQTPERAEALLLQVWQGARQQFLNELAQVEDTWRRQGQTESLHPGDWHALAQQVQKERYAFDVQEMADYFPRSHVRPAIFQAMGQLFGISFEHDPQLPVFADRVDAYQVKREGKTIGVVYVDDFPRPTKSGGAWMEQGQSVNRWSPPDQISVVGNALNLTDTLSDPRMTTMDVITALHELGHGLHGLLSQCAHPSQSGTQVPTDFVEFPSQLLENWASHPQVLQSFSSHYQTGAPIPAQMIQQWQAATTFNRGFLRGEYLLSAFLDLRLHQLDEAAIETLDLTQFTRDTQSDLGCPAMLPPRYDLTHFTHIFETDYAARYYAYLWSEVLDADVFAAFEHKGLFDPELAHRLATEVYARGHSRPAMESFIALMGREPDPTALMRRSGMLPKETQAPAPTPSRSHARSSRPG